MYSDSKGLRLERLAAGTLSRQAEAEGPKAPPPAFDLVAPRDIAATFGLAFFFGLAWSLPEHRWAGVCRRLAGVSSHVIRGSASGLTAAVCAKLGGQHLDAAPEAIALEHAAIQIERFLPFIREHHPKGWQADVALEGQDHLDRALDRGLGAILWDSNFAFAGLVTKIATFRAGYPMSHLSHPRHGFSPSRYGTHVLNPLITRVERRYLKDRVVMGRHDASAALETLRQRLVANGLVSVTARDTARRPLVAPLFGGEINLGPGAPVLAHKSGAALLPVFSVREPDGRYRVRIDPPLDLPAQATRGSFLAAAAGGYAERLEPQVRAYAGQWLGWADEQ